LRARAYRAIVDRIQQDIVDGRLQAGDRLPSEHLLAEQFGVSRAGVREALRVLELQGLVDVRHGYAGGAFVAEPGHSPILGALQVSLRLGQCSADELYQARLLLEPALARLAVERAGAVLAARLGENVARTGQALARGLSVSALNREFHAIVAEVADNRVLGVMMQALQELLENLDQRFPNAPDVSRCAFDEHGEILAAVRAGDAPRTETLMRNHLQRLQGRVRRGEGARTPSASVPAVNGSTRLPAEAARAAAD